jgi:superfamily II DNA or RNA helicase
LGYKVNDFCGLFTYKNPLIYKLKRLKLSIKKTPVYLKHYKIVQQGPHTTVQVPRGCLDRVKDFYAKNKIPLRIIDYRVSHPEIDVHLLETELEAQQNEIIDMLVQKEGGLIEMSPGGGKTIAILGLIAKVKQPTLILVHEDRLSKQWMSEIKNRLTGNFKLGKYDGFKKEEGDVVVGIINSIYNKYIEDPAYLQRFGMVVIDECHHIPATMFLSVINNIPAKYRVGITGTVKRKDDKELLTYDILGKLLIKKDAQDLKHRITNFEYRVVNTGIRMEFPTIRRWTGKKRENVNDSTKFISQLVENNDRNDVILREVVWCIENGYFPLVLSDRVSHNELIHERLTTMGYRSILLIGKTRTKTNWDDIRKDETVQCIVANTKIASEGLDLPRLSALLSTCPSSNRPKIKQQIGRIRRVSPGKPIPLVVDFCDNLVYALDEDGEKQFLLRYATENRIRFYNELIMEYNG